MTEQQLAPQMVYRACIRGLKRHDRASRTTMDTGATAAALSFAEIIAAGRPIDASIAVEVLEAHRLLDEAPRHPDGLSEQEIVSRLLWGGDDAPEWAERIVTAERQTQLDQLPPAPVAAAPVPHAPTVPHVPHADRPAPAMSDVFGQPMATTTNVGSITITPADPDHVAAATATEQLLDDLSDDLFDLDEQTVAELRSAFWLAYRTALRASSSAARNRTARVSAADRVAAGIDHNDLDQIKGAVIDACPYDGYRAIPDSVAAVIDVDLDRALSGALDDYQQVVRQAMGRAKRAAIRTIADRLGVTVAEVEALAQSDDGIGESAIGLRLALHEWVRARLEGDRAPEDLADLSAPEDAFADAVRVAAGATPADDEAESVGAPLATRVLDRVSRGLILSSVAGLASTVIRPRWTWDYGSVASRETGPYEPHHRLRNQTWMTPEERLAKVGTAAPKGDANGGNCQCRIKRGWVVLPGVRPSA